MEKNIGIQKILWQSEVKTEEGKMEVLIPFPINPDECLRHIGITDFGDESDESYIQWHDEFMGIIHQLFDESKTKLTTTDSEINDYIDNGHYNFSDIPLILNQADHVTIKFESENRFLFFTGGHEIFWLKNISEKEIQALGFPLEKIDNDKLGRIF